MFFVWSISLLVIAFAYTFFLVRILSKQLSPSVSIISSTEIKKLGNQPTTEELVQLLPSKDAELGSHPDLTHLSERVDRLEKLIRMESRIIGFGLAALGAIGSIASIVSVWPTNT